MTHPKRPTNFLNNLKSNEESHMFIDSDTEWGYVKQESDWLFLWMVKYIKLERTWKKTLHS